MWHEFATSVSNGSRDSDVARADSASSGLTFSEVLPQKLGANPSNATCGACGCLFPYEVGSLCNVETIMMEEERNCH